MKVLYFLTLCLILLTAFNCKTTHIYQGSNKKISNNPQGGEELYSSVAFGLVDLGRKRGTVVDCPNNNVAKVTMQKSLLNGLIEVMIGTWLISTRHNEYYCEIK